MPRRSVTGCRFTQTSHPQRYQHSLDPSSPPGKSRLRHRRYATCDSISKPARCRDHLPILRVAPFVYGFARLSTSTRSCRPPNRSGPWSKASAQADRANMPATAGHYGWKRLRPLNCRVAHGVVENCYIACARRTFCDLHTPTQM